MNTQGNGDWDGQSLEVEDYVSNFRQRNIWEDDNLLSYSSNTSSSDDISYITETTINSSEDSETVDLIQSIEQLQRPHSQESTRPTRRGGRRRKKSHKQKEDNPRRYAFIFTKDPWGDPMKIADRWPEDMSTFRLVGCNVGGISHYYDMQEWEIILGYLNDMQTDCFCLSEINLNLRHPEISDKLYEYKHRLDRHMKLAYSCSKPLKMSDKFQMGGTVVGVSGRWSGRDLQLKLQYPVRDHGRWTISHLKGKGTSIISIISIYRVCPLTQGGKNTIAMQQQRDIQAATGNLVNPRAQFTEDISTTIQYLQSLSHHIIVCGDVNEDMNDKSPTNTWREMLRTCNLSVVSDIKFPGAHLPATFDNGPKCLDMVAISHGISPTSIKAMGYLPFCDPLPSDHRAIYVDLDAESLFGSQLPDLTRSSFRHFTSRNIKQSRQYTDALLQHYSQSKLIQKVFNLKNDILQSDGNNTEMLITRCKKLEKKSREYMIAAEKSLCKGRYGKKHWSSATLTHAAVVYILLKKQRRHMRLNGNYTVADYDSLEDDIAQAYIHLRDCQKNSRQLRDEDLTDTAEHLSAVWGTAPEQVKKVLLHAEQQKRTFTKLKRCIKNNAILSLKNLYVPKPCIEPLEHITDDEDPSHRWIDVLDSDAIFDIVLRKNANSLMRSSEAISATGPFQQELGYLAEKDEFVNALLSGKVDAERLASAYPGVREELGQFIQSCCSMPTREEMRWKFDADDYKSLFLKTRESTACGPSGLHMSHWKVASQDDTLASINAFFMWAAFQLGFVYDRWLISWHCMLLKKKYPYVDKLRIIQLFEGDFNGMLKTLLGRHLMRHMVHTGQIDSNTFGSIPGRDAKEAMKLLDMVYLNHRLYSRVLVTVFNDAAGCYDRIRPNMADIAMRRVGCPASVTHAHTLAQLKMIHRIKTSMGVSRGTIKWGPSPLTTIMCAGTLHFIGNIGGIGQGGGGSPVGWLVVLLIMIDAYRKFSPGAMIIDPLGHMTFSMHLVSYVDDNSLLRSFDPDTPIQEILSTISTEMTSWLKLLQITGGDLALDKCTYSMMKWQWSGYYNTRSMVLPLQNQTVTISTSSSAPINIRNLDPHTAERQLGIRLSMDGNWKQEFQYRKDQTNQLTAKIYYARLTPSEALLAYQFYIKATLYYALPITVFSYAECDELNKIILNRILPKCGLNRHTPRSLVYAPKGYGGLEYDHIWTKQLSLHLELLTKHLRRDDALGRSILANFNCMQQLTGRSLPFLSLNPDHHAYVDQSGSLGYIWKSCYQLDIQCIIPGLKIRTAAAVEGDVNIMDIAVEDPLVAHNLHKLEALNACRLYHGVTSLSDMSQYDGRKINKGYMVAGQKRRIHQSMLQQWPVQPCPTEWQWSIWKSFIYRHFITGCGDSRSFPPGTKSRVYSPVQTSQNLIQYTRQQYPDLETSITALPADIRYYLGDIHLPAQQDGRFVQSIRNNQLIGATDGSAHSDSKDGAFSYLLTIQDSSDIIYGGGKLCPGDDVTSQQTEHYGVIAIHVLLLAIGCCIETESVPPVTIWVDNENTQQRVERTPRCEGNTQVYLSADYDLWSLLALIRQHMKIRVMARWVKAHQDISQPIDLLPIEAKLNVLADSIASKTYNYSSAMPQRPPHDAEGLLLAHKGQHFHDINSTLRAIIHVPDFENYICIKRKWTHDQFTRVQWKSLSVALNKFKPITRQNIIQLMHNWQHTGYQKHQFFESSVQNMDHMEKIAALKYAAKHFQCPYCHTSVEMALHYVTCTTVVECYDFREKRGALTRKLRKMNIYDGIIDIINFLLKGGQIGRYEHSPPTPTLTHVWQQAWDSQNRLGWTSFLQGFWHSDWLTVQNEYCSKRTTIPVGTGTQWLPSVLHAILEYLYDCWMARNDKLHHSDTSESRRTELEMKVRQLYSDPDRHLCSTREKRRLFGIPVDRRLKGSNAALESWIDLVEMRLRLDRETHAKQTLMRWMGQEQMLHNSRGNSQTRGDMGDRA